jgi:hypothetical protein
MGPSIEEVEVLLNDVPYPDDALAGRLSISVSLMHIRLVPSGLIRSFAGCLGLHTL